MMSRIFELVRCRLVCQEEGEYLRSLPNIMKFMTARTLCEGGGGGQRGHRAREFVASALLLNLSVRPDTIYY